MRTLVRAAIRIILIYLFLETLFYTIRYCCDIFHIYTYFEPRSRWFDLLVIIGAAVICFVILSLLWWKTDWLVNVLAGKVSNHELIIATSNLDLFKVAIRILGIFLLITSIPALVGLIGYHFSYPDDLFNTYAGIQPQEIRELIIIGMKILIGIGMILGTKGIYRVIDIIDTKIHMADNEPKNPDNAS